MSRGKCATQYTLPGITTRNQQVPILYQNYNIGLLSVASKTTTVPNTVNVRKTLIYYNLGFVSKNPAMDIIIL